MANAIRRVCSRVKGVVPVVALCAAAIACSDGTGPETLSPGTFRVVVTGARSERFTGDAKISNPFPDFYTITLTPRSGGPDFGLGIGFFALGRPAVGTHQIRRFGEAPEMSAGCVRTPSGTGCPLWSSERGELRVTRSSPERVAGSFTADLVDMPFNPAGTARLHVEGAFDARCPAGDTCR